MSHQGKFSFLIFFFFLLVGESNHLSSPKKKFCLNNKQAITCKSIFIHSVVQSSAILQLDKEHFLPSMPRLGYIVCILGRRIFYILFYLLRIYMSKQLLIYISKQPQFLKKKTYTASLNTWSCILSISIFTYTYFTVIKSVIKKKKKKLHGKIVEQTE